MTTQRTESPDETIAAGRTLAASLTPGTVIALEGEVGAGKTHFVRGLVEGWGGKEQTTSPTFSIVNEYETPCGPVFHLDFYRARSADEIWSAAHDELESPHGLVVIEWANLFPALIPSGPVQVSIAHLTEEERSITMQK